VRDVCPITPAAALDLNDNDLVVASASFANVQGLVITGYRSTVDPTATGIISTTSQNSAGQTVLALFNNALAGANQWPPASGQTIAANAIVGKYTYFGDINLDGQVTGDDYAVVDANLNSTPLPGVAWLSGDANLDGIVTGDDYGAIDANLGLGAGNPLAPSSIPVPEAALVGFVASLLPLRRIRRRRS